MKTKLVFAFAAVLCTSIASGQVLRHHTAVVSTTVPSSGTGGQAGGASNPANLAYHTTDFPEANTVGSVSVFVHVVHGRVGDLTMTLYHCGTSVTLFAGSANQAASANASYTFNDAASTTFAAVVNQAQGPVLAGAYKPAQLLSAFNGQNSTGPWTLIVADLATGFSGTVAWMEISVMSGASFNNSILPYIPIPDGSNGQCVSPVTRTITVPTSGQVGSVDVTVHLQHTYASDLTMTLTHAGVTATLIAADTPICPANLFGGYAFSDSSTIPWAQAVSGLPTGATIPLGFFQPLTPLSAFAGLNQAGDWTLSVCDQYPGDTGSFWSVSLSIAGAAWDLQIQQPSGALAITLTNSGGAMGGIYANVMTLAPGAFPNGWLHGLDITLNEITAQVAFGAPFFGTLGPCGSTTTTVYGPIPSGLTVYVASIELDASIAIVNFKHAFAYTTL